MQRYAMIFAAGLGTRLRPLTDDRPKALVEVGGIPLIELQLQRLRHHGFTDVVVNVHHFADKLEAHVRAGDYGLQVHVSDERDLLLDTGGGLKKAAALFPKNAPVFICNVDVVSDLDPNALLKEHHRNGAIATLALRDRPTDRLLVVDDEMHVRGWKNAKSGETKGDVQPNFKALAFSGQHVVSAELFPLMRQTGAFSIIDTYLDLAPTGRVMGWMDQSSVWMDVGKPAELEMAAGLLAQVMPWKS